MKVAVLVLGFVMVSCSSQTVEKKPMPKHIQYEKPYTVPDECVAEKLPCEDAVGYFCGVRVACGVAAECGRCPGPYTCGSQDLQMYEKFEYRCGLKCSLERVGSWNCDRLAPIEYACETTDELTAFVKTDEFLYKYSCYSLGVLRGGRTHFCCGL